MSGIAVRGGVPVAFGADRLHGHRAAPRLPEAGAGRGGRAGEVAVRVRCTEPRLRARWDERLSAAGVPTTTGPGGPGGSEVVLAVGHTLEQAVELCGPAVPGRRCPVLVAADRVSPEGVLRAVRSGVRTVLRAADASPTQLAAAVLAAHHGDGRLPYGVLVRLLNGPGGGAETPARANSGTSEPLQPLTPRQTAVLALVAEGHGNAVIARVLSCSEHTVKNVIYELMSRLQVRNRAHAVARAVRAGLI